MIRLLLRLFRIKDFEPNETISVLKEQLKIANEENHRLTDTLLNILQPKAVEATPIELNQIASSSAIFSRRRAALEAKDREEARIIKSSTNLGKPDFVTDKITTEQLEKELNVEEA